MNQLIERLAEDPDDAVRIHKRWRQEQDGRSNRPRQFCAVCDSPFFHDHRRQHFATAKHGILVAQTSEYCSRQCTAGEATPRVNIQPRDDVLMDESIISRTTLHDGRIARSCVKCGGHVNIVGAALVHDDDLDVIEEVLASGSVQ